jgi:dipeptidyl aminopeptidase/acylaminoacyl peptidase
MYAVSQFGGPPFDEHARTTTYEKWSPSAFVRNWKTPTLVIHGGQDYRIPETEGIATFTALQRQGVPSRFLFFPDEPHWYETTLNQFALLLFPS